MPLFGGKETYLYGRILNNKFITPTTSYPIKPLDVSSGMHPVRFAGKIEVFYLSSIFNSYLVSSEENVGTLFSVDGKVTITRDKITKDTLYTFKVVKETASLRIAELYKFDTFYPGFKTRGEVKWEQSRGGKKVPIVRTKYGNGPVLLQNNRGSVEIDVVLYKKDEYLHFVQVDEPVDGVVDLSITNAISNGKYGVRKFNVKGILITPQEYKTGDSVRCVVKEVCFGHYLFVEHVEVKIGSVIEAQVESYLKDRIVLKYGDMAGYMPKNESKRHRYGKTVRGVVYDICGSRFLLSTKRAGTDMGGRKIDLSVPFDVEDDEDSCDMPLGEEVVDGKKTLAAERKRSKIMNEEDFLMDIRAHPGEAMPVIKYMQHKMEINEMEAPREIFREFLPKTSGEEKDKLCISFVNYLLFIKDGECLRTIRRLMKICSPKFLEVVASNTEDVQIMKLHFETSKTKTSFKMYLEALFRDDEGEAVRVIEKNKEFLSSSIDMIYKYSNNPRVLIEKLLVDRKDAWLSYIRNESGSYLRGLFRRVVDKKWRVPDMKEFYRMWLEFEKENGGNVEEVKLRAKEYVDSVKNRNLSQQAG